MISRKILSPDYTVIYDSSDKLYGQEILVRINTSEQHLILSICLADVRKINSLKWGGWGITSGMDPNKCSFTAEAQSQQRICREKKKIYFPTTFLYFSLIISANSLLALRLRGE